MKIMQAPTNRKFYFYMFWRHGGSAALVDWFFHQNPFRKLFNSWSYLTTRSEKTSIFINKFIYSICI